MTTKSIYKKLSEFVAKNPVEIFMIESPQNHYQPEPPEGYFAVRSAKRRLFVRLDEGRRIPSNLSELLKDGKYIECPL